MDARGQPPGQPGHQSDGGRGVQDLPDLREAALKGLVFVTGATGFLGGHLCEHLVRTGYRVRALARPTSDTSLLQRLGAELAEGSVADVDALARALDGVDAVVHAAGLIRVRRVDEYVEVNVRGTENVLAAVRRAGLRPRRFVYVSSLAVTGPSDGPYPPPADRPPAPVTTYGRTKAAGEAAVLAEAGTMPVTSIRPPTIYGPRDRELLGFFRGVARGVRVTFTPEGAVSMLHVSDCASAIEAALSKEHPSGRVFPVDDGPPHSLDEIGRQIEAALGRRALRIPVPRAFIFPAAAVSEAAARVLGKPTLFNRDKAPEIAGRWWVCGNEAIRRELGWSPAFSLADGIRQTAAWYRAQGLL